MTKSLIYSLLFHALMISLTILSLPFMLREPIDLPPIVSVELIQISDKTSIPYAPKARKVIEEVKENFELTLYYDDITLDSFKGVVKWLDDNKIEYSLGEITDRFNPSNWGQGDFFGLSQCDYIISRNTVTI